MNITPSNQNGQIRKPGPKKAPADIKKPAAQEPPQGDKVDLGNQENEASFLAKAGSRALNVGIGAATGYWFGDMFQGSMKATLIASAPGIIMGSVAIGGGVALMAGMIGAKSGSKNATRNALLWGGGTAIAVGALLTGGAAAGQALTNALPWSAAVNGAVMGGGTALLGSGTDWTKVGGFIKDKMGGGDEAKTDIQPPNDPKA